MDKVKFTRVSVTTRIPFAWNYPPRGLAFLIQNLLGRGLTNAQWKAVYRFQRKKNGICTDCHEKAAPDKTYCQSCSDNMSVRGKVRMQEKKDNGICITSGCPEKAAPGKTRCQSCADNKNARGKVKTQEKKDNGICIQNGCPEKAAPDKTYCHSCLDKKNAQAKVKFQKKKKNGICSNCHEKAAPDKTLCVTCNEINCARNVIRDAVQGDGDKKSARTEEIVMCSLEELRSHLRSTLPKGVTDPTGYHIDHVIPVNAAKGVRWKRYAVNHYTNLRYLWGPENLAKSDDHDPKDAVAYFKEKAPLYQDKFA